MEATTRRARAEAFERAMLRDGLAPRAEWTFAWDPEDAHSGDTETRKLFAADETPTGIVAANDHTAIRLIELVEATGREVPGDVSVIGFDGIAMGELSRIALTTVAQPGDELARRAVDLLFRRIERGFDDPPEQHRLQPSLVVRGSTAQPS
jgi:DNA-binding LacI/PurR family transcriptional regulator